MKCTASFQTYQVWHKLILHDCVRESPGAPSIHTFFNEHCALVPSSVHAFSHTEMVWLGNMCRMNYIRRCPSTCG